MNINKLIAGAMTAGLGLIAYGTVPEVSDVMMKQAGWGRLVTITYTLNASAVVTLDVQTNANTSASADDPGWTSIGGVAVSNAKGDVWKKVEAGSHTITWRPDQSWPGHDIAAGGARAVVTAWSLNNTPDYMVVDISKGAQPNTQRYYPSVDHLPGSVLGQTGAITNNPIYKMTMIVMRKIMAKDVIWTMGSTTFDPNRNPHYPTIDNESAHHVCLTNNYYIGVFPVTQGQWALIQTEKAKPSYYSGSDLPVEKVSYNEIRMAANSATAAGDAEEWPAAPYAGSFLDLLRTKTGVDFDLPSEAEWEFAARAGNGDSKWGDGSSILKGNTDENLARLGNYQGSGLEKTTSVGSYKPNDWGLYDVYGNVFEWCLDWYVIDRSSLQGAVNNTDSEVSGKRMLRGGSFAYWAPYCRPSCRFAFAPDKDANMIGFRLTCKAGLD